MSDRETINRQVPTGSTLNLTAHPRAYLMFEWADTQDGNSKKLGVVHITATYNANVHCHGTLIVRSGAETDPNKKKEFGIYSLRSMNVPKNIQTVALSIRYEGEDDHRPTLTSIVTEW